MQEPSATLGHPASQPLQASPSVLKLSASYGTAMQVEACIVELGEDGEELGVELQVAPRQDAEHHELARERLECSFGSTETWSMRASGGLSMHRTFRNFTKTPSSNS